jgi:thiol-disulfide isomerase/thioredoxin
VTPDASELALEAFRGKVVVLNLWASWCAPCRAEIPRLNRLAAEGHEDLVVVGVNVEGLDGGRLAGLMGELGIDYVVASPTAELGGSFAWNGLLPFTWLIDKGGRVRAAHGGLPAEHALRRACETLLGEEP